jgi:hypothetical protein
MRSRQLFYCALFFAIPLAYGSIDIGPLSEEEIKEHILLSQKTAERTTNDFISWSNDQTTLIMQRSPVAQRPGR